MVLAKPRIVPHLVGESVKIFRESVRSEETWIVYQRRFVRFLQWLGFENNADEFRGEKDSSAKDD